MFHKKNFCHVSSTNRGCPQYSIYVYKTTDSVETMLSAGYFNGALLDLHKNDVILAGIISDIDDGQYSTAWFRVIKRSLDAIEVEQVLTSADNITYDGTGTNYLSQFANVQDAISALDAELKKESTERTQGQDSLQGQIGGINKKIPETASASNQLATESDINTLQGQIDDNSREIKGLQGAGGALTATNLGSNPTQQSITEYAIDQIWPNNTNFTWNASNPAASTFTDANGIARTAAEIFNSTWVNNTYDDHRWQLTNTQNTEPKVFEWADVGRDIVSVATATTAGIVRVGSGSQMVVNASTGDISLDGSKAESIRTTIGALANNQGTDNAGKFMGVNTGGDVVPIDGASGAGRNIGDIFWTTRTDSALNGAVEANGALYYFPDVNGGDNNIQLLIANGSLPYLPIAEFDATVAEQGGCDSFGYDLGTSYFKVPKKVGRVLVRSQKPTADNNYTWYNVYADGWVEQGGHNDGKKTQGTNTFAIEMADLNYSISLGRHVISGTDADPAAISFQAHSCTTTGFTCAQTYATGGSGGYGAGSSYAYDWVAQGYAAASEYTPDKWDYQNIQVLRPMVQLFNGATDEALATCTEVLATVAGLELRTDGMIDYVVESQEPTSGNGFTWYRLYKSGWVEQGGYINTLVNNKDANISFPIEMVDKIFSLSLGQAFNVNYIYEQRHAVENITNRTTTGVSIRNARFGGSTSAGISLSWKVSGMSAQGA